MIILIAMLFLNNVSFILKEDTLHELISPNVAQWEKIQDSWRNEVIKSNQKSDEQIPTVMGQVFHERTNRKPLIRFSPVFSPVTKAQIGFKRKSVYGLEYQTLLGTDSYNFSLDGVTPQHITQLSAEFKASVNLWKNFQGKLDQLEKFGLEGSLQASLLKKKIQEHALYLELKKSYYDLIINNEGRLAAVTLYEQAQKQTEYVKNKLQYSASDESELQRFIAQQYSRKSAIQQLELERERIILGLRSIFHQLNSKKIEIDKYDLSKKETLVSECLATITSTLKTPEEFSHLGHIQKEMDKLREYNLKEVSYYQEMDINFDVSLKTTGVKDSYFKSYEDAFAHNRLGISVGLNINIPLPGESRTKQLKITRIKMQQEYSKREIDQQLIGLHEYARNSLAVLGKNIENNTLMTQALSKRVALQQKKFEQGRVGVNEFIQDQDALLESQFSKLTNQQAIIHGLIQYLQTFHLFPCEFNK